MSNRTLYATVLGLWVALILIAATATAAVFVVHAVEEPAATAPATTVPSTNAVICAAGNWSCVFSHR